MLIFQCYKSSYLKLKFVNCITYICTYLVFSTDELMAFPVEN